MHDTVDLEERGIPGVFVATTEFVEAGEKQAAALGYDPAAVYVPHPIQDRTPEEVTALADAAYDEVLDQLVGRGEGRAG